MPNLAIVVLLGFLASAGARAGGAPAQVIDCTAEIGEKKPLAIRIDDHLSYQERGAERKVPVLNREIRGAGAHARTLITFENGYLRFKDTYGCLSEIELVLPKGGPPLKKIQCVIQGAPRCAR